MDLKIDHAQRHHLLQTKELLDPYAQTMQILMDSSIDYEFRTTLIKPYHNHQAFESMLSLIQGARHYALQIYRPQITLDQDFDGQSFSYEEMCNFQTIAQNYVQHCEIR
jgi:pyruvate formate lyase activating enzyme